MSVAIAFRVNGKSTPATASLSPHRRVVRVAVFWLLGVCAAFAALKTVSAYPYPTYQTYVFDGSHRFNHTATVLPSGEVLLAGGKLAESTVLNSSVELEQYYVPFEGPSRPSATMQAERYAHTAVLLPTGRVLASGGRNATGAHFSQETYDPIAREWNAAAALFESRAWHTASLLWNGRVLLVGGENGSALAAAEIFDPSTGTMLVTASLAQGRYAHTATALQDGKLLVVGGRTSDSALASAEVFDADAGEWTTIAPMTVARFRHEAVRLRDGRVLVVGGYGTTGQPLTSCELYDPATGQWTTTGPLHEARAAFASVALPNGNVFAIGGQTSGDARLGQSEEYLVASGSWRRVEEPATPEPGLFAGLSDLTATLFPTGRIVVAGGTSNGNQASFLFSSLMTYSSGSLIPTAPVTTVARSRQSILLPDGRALITGGMDASGQVVAAVDTYDFRSQTWKPAAPMTTPRQDHVLVMLHDGRVLAVGGYGGDFGQQAVASCDIYHPVTDTWSAASPMQTPRRQPGVALLADGRVLVAGGKPAAGGPLGPNALSSVEVYDPPSDSWSTLPDMPMALGASKAFATRDDTISVVGKGASQAGFYRYSQMTGLWSGLSTPGSIGEVDSLVQMANGYVFSARGSEMGGVYLDGRETWWPAPISFNASPLVHTLLLHDGRVLSASQQGTGGATEFTETLEPLLLRWYHRLTIPHLHSSGAVMLPDGKALLLGTTIAGNPPANVADLHDPGLGYHPDWQPRIDAARITPEGKLVLTGSGFRNLIGVSNGSADSPVVRVQHVQSGRSLFLLPDAAAPWSDEFFQSADLGGISHGHVSAILYANGVPSEPVMLSLSRPGFSVETAQAEDVPHHALIAFPNTLINVAGAIELMVHNPGPAAVNDLKAYFTGAATGPFSSTLGATTIAPGESTTLSLQFSSAQGGAFTSNLVLASAEGAGGFHSLRLSGRAVDASPVISAIDNQVVVEDGETGEIAFTVSDPDAPAASLALSAFSSDPTLLAPAGIVFGGSGDNRNFKLKPESNRFGQTEVTIVVTDGASEGRTTFSLTVLAVNDPPSFSVASSHGPIPVDAGLQVIPLTELSAGPFEEQALTIAVSAETPEHFASLQVVETGQSAPRIEFTPNPARTGRSTLTVTVSDGSADFSQDVQVAILPRITPLAVAQPEGNEGLSPMAFRLLIEPPHDETIQIQFATVASGTAVAGSDFTAAEGILTIPPSTSEAVIPIQLIGDTRLELDETFSLQLGNAADADFLTASTPVGTILNDDAQPTLPFAPSWVTVVDEGAPSVAWIEVKLPNALDIPVTWQVSTREGTALAGTHFEPLAPVALSFAPGQTSKWIAITVPAGGASGGEKEFYLDLATTSGPHAVATATTVLKRLTITDFHAVAPGLYVVRFPAALGQSYILQEATSLTGPWRNASPILIGGNGPATQAVLTDSPAAFFQVVTAPQAPGTPDLGP